MKYEYFCLMRNMLLINKQFLITMYNPNYVPKYTYFHYTILNSKSLSRHFSKKKKKIEFLKPAKHLTELIFTQNEQWH